MNKNQGIATLAVGIIAVAILFAGIIIFFSSQGKNPLVDNGNEGLNNNGKKSETAVWTVYRNEQNAFEIKFPQYGTVNDTDFGKTYAFGVEISASQWKGGKAAVINHGNVGTLTLKNFAAADLKAQGVASAALKDIKFNGYDSVQAEENGKTSYYVLHNLDVFEIYKIGSATDIDKTLSTFKFLEQ